MIYKSKIVQSTINDLEILITSLLLLWQSV